MKSLGALMGEKSQVRRKDKIFIVFHCFILGKYYPIIRYISGHLNPRNTQQPFTMVNIDVPWRILSEPYSAPFSPSVQVSNFYFFENTI